MYHKTRKLLKKISKNVPYNKIYYVNIETCTFDEVSDKNVEFHSFRFPMDSPDILGALKELEKNGYINFVNDSSYFTVTYRGHNWRGIIIDEIKNTILSKFFYGFLTGVATAIATQILVPKVWLFIESILQTSTP